LGQFIKTPAYILRRLHHCYIQFSFRHLCILHVLVTVFPGQLQRLQIVQELLERDLWQVVFIFTTHGVILQACRGRVLFILSRRHGRLGILVDVDALPQFGILLKLLDDKKGDESFLLSV